MSDQQPAPQLTEEDKQRFKKWFKDFSTYSNPELVGIDDAFDAVFEYATLYERSRQPDELAKAQQRVKELEQALGILHTKLLVVHKPYKGTIHYEVTKEILEKNGKNKAI